MVESLNLPKVQYDVNEMQSKFSYLADITFPEFKEDEVTLLIGTLYGLTSSSRLHKGKNRRIN